MLGKLLKWEFLSTARTILPVYAGAVLLAGLIALLGMPWNVDADSEVLTAASGFLFFFFVLALFAVAFLTFILIIRRFYKSLFKDQGYLSHTLPVSVDTQLWSKLIAAVCWSFASALIIFLSLLLMAARQWAVIDFDTVANVLREAFGEIGWFLALRIIFYVILSTLSGFLMVYASMSIGQLAKRRKILLSVGVYFGMSYALSILMTVIPMAMYFSAPTVDFSLWIDFLGIFTLIQCVGFYFITRSILRYKLNLE